MEEALTLEHPSEPPIQHPIPVIDPTYQPTCSVLATAVATAQAEQQRGLSHLYLLLDSFSLLFMTAIASVVWQVSWWQFLRNELLMALLIFLFVSLLRSLKH